MRLIKKKHYQNKLKFTFCYYNVFEISISYTMSQIKKKYLWYKVLRIHNVKFQSFRIRYFPNGTVKINEMFSRYY